MESTLSEKKKEEMLKFFFQLTEMLGNLVDDILPDVVLHLDQRTLEALINRCRDTSTNLSAFLKLCEVVKRKKLSFSSHSNETTRLKSTNEVEAAPEIKSQVTNQSNPPGKECDATLKWKEILTKAIGICNLTNELTNFSYCGLCNVFSCAPGPWNDHMAAKKHKARAKDDTCTLITCDTCNFQIFGGNALINTILSSPQHNLLDLAVNEMTNVAETSKVLPEQTEITSSQQTPTKKKTSHALLKNQTDELHGKENISEALVTFEGKVIHSDFVNLSSEIAVLIEKHKDFFYCFCRPCETLSRTRINWEQHCKSPRHIAKANDPNFNNCLAACSRCDFGMVASKGFALTYLHYHIEKCHNLPTKNINDKDCMRVVELGIGKAKKNFKSSSGSLKGSTNNLLDWSRASSSNDLSRPSAEDSPMSGRSTPSQSGINKMHQSNRQLAYQSQGYSSNKYESNSHFGYDDHSSEYDSNTNASPQPKHVGYDCNSTASNSHHNQAEHQKNDDCFPEHESSASPSCPKDRSTWDPRQTDQFVELLRKKEEAFKCDPQFKPFSALCFECDKSDFPDEFDWLNHCMQHLSTNDVQEDECDNCNTYLFGNTSMIKELLSHPKHVSLDQLISTEMK